jgi:hypothetical protein
MNNTYKNAKHPTICTLFEEAEEQEQEDAASKQAAQKVRLTTWSMLYIDAH